MSQRKITFYIALALFAQESTWNFYDNQVPVLLREHVTSAALVGALMGMDNLLGIFIQPWIGNRSDNTRTRWGRRIPYLAVGMPLAALIFALLPWTTSLTMLVAVMFGYALVANTMRPLAESLTPDFIPPERRGRTNAVVKIATALTIIVASLISLLLVDDHPRLSFAIPSLILLAATAVLLAKVRDSASRAYRAAVAEDAAARSTAIQTSAAPTTAAGQTTAAAQTTAAGNATAAAAGPVASRVPFREVIAELVTDRDRRRLLLLLTVLLFGGAWFASRSLITPYGMEVLGLSRGDAGGLTLPSGIAYVIAAYPAALLAERLGRLRVIGAGMLIFAVALAAGTVVPTTTATVVAFCVASVGAAGFTINAAVALWNLAPSSRVLGTYTGLYAVTWYLGGFGGPALIGGVVDLLGWRGMLGYAAVLALLAVLVVVRLGRLTTLAAQQGSEPATR